MDLLGVMLVLFVIVPILAVLSIPIAPVFYVIGVLIILGGLLFSIDSNYKSVIIITCLIVGLILCLIGAGLDGQHAYNLLF
jgi:hypothetical protein